ncbi:MAG: DNA-methyltransferase [Spirochaetota bacterium]
MSNLSFEFRSPQPIVFTSEQRYLVGNAGAMPLIGDESVHLVVTSPPYPMIEMWDEVFARANEAVSPSLSSGDGGRAFEAMHEVLDGAWREAVRVLVPGGLLCINIGDATRSIGDRFSLYSNHARIVERCVDLGLESLPLILWRKPTNAPNKFMGSGMLPGGAYVTLEHEYILIFRKGGKREYTNEDRERRRASAYFWEERNRWFSDTWSFTGTRQTLEAPSLSKELRTRSAAYPLELPWRLIHMYSLQQDTVVDPFVGTGTTLLAAAACGRNGIGVEIDPVLCRMAAKAVAGSHDIMQRAARDRCVTHRAFVAQRAQEKPPRHHNDLLGMPVITSQERLLQIPYASEIESIDSDSYLHQTISYSYLTTCDE